MGPAPSTAPRPRLAAFLAALDAAPPAQSSTSHRSGELALLAAVYSTRPVRALEADGERAHATRQAAATNALPVVVEERPVEDLDAYAARAVPDAAVLRLGPGADSAALLGRGRAC